MSDDEPVLDPEVIECLRELCDDDEPDLLAEMVTLFTEDSRPRLAAMEAAVAACDPGALERAAHALKSSCANLGATRMTELCQELETMGRGGSTDGAAPLMIVSKSEFDRVVDALQSELS